jgi:hypothetical protein
MAAFRSTVRVFINNELAPAAQSARLAEAARAGVADLIAAGRASKRYALFVDGHDAMSEDGARAVISYRFNYIADAALLALKTLQDQAPVASGGYRESFFVSVNGRLIRADQFTPSAVPYDAEIIIGNTAPFNRKVDVQFSGRVRLRYSNPPNEYENARQAVLAQYRTVVKAVRLYNISFPGQYVLKRGSKAGSYSQSPALSITPVI